MSHDIRTPMNAVIGMTEIARHHLNEPAYVEACLEKVALSGNHLLTLVNDILDISKVESGKMTLNPTPFSVREMAEGIYAMVRQAAVEKDILLRREVGEVQCDTVVGDTLRLQQILINLLNNAIKYTEEGGHVTFEVSQRPAKKEGRVGLQFVNDDDGIGMSEEFQKMMYSTFSRATDSRINTIQGSGFGLAIVKQMVELMHGTIACQSEEGRGTTFVVNLELPEADEKQAEERREESGENEKSDSFVKTSGSLFDAKDGRIGTTENEVKKTMESKRKVLQKLFLSTLYLSAFTFGGGYVIVTLMKKKFVDEYHWIEENEMLDLVAIAQSSPGPIAVNGAIVVGYKLAGMIGVLVSIIGTIIPPFLIISVISVCYQAFRDNFFVSQMLEGMQAGVGAVIASVTYEMGAGVVKEKDKLSLAILVGAFAAACFFGINVIYIVLVCGAIGALRTVLAKRRGAR